MKTPSLALGRCPAGIQKHHFAPRKPPNCTLEKPTFALDSPSFDPNPHSKTDSPAGADVASGLTATIATPISENAAGRQLNKTGAGTLILSGANSYTGGTDIQAGTLRLGASNVIPDRSTVKVAAIAAGQTATLDANGNSDTIGSLTLGGATAANTPEPCSAMLLAFGAMGLLRRRGIIGRTGR